MRIKEHHYAHMLAEIKKLPTQKIIAHMNSLSLSKTRIKDVNKRFRWDLYYAANLIRWTVDVLYPLEINDEHIDTALRKIVKELKLPNDGEIV